MKRFRHLNHSFVHGVAAYSAYALGPFVQHLISLIAAVLFCVYAGWFRQANVVAFLGGVIVAVAGWTAMAIFSSPEVGFGVFLMVPFALTVILPKALAGYVIGKITFALAHRRHQGGESGG